jgi:hypothetical protein
MQRNQQIRQGLITPERFEGGIRDLERTTEADETFCYTFFKGIAHENDPDRLTQV